MGKSAGSQTSSQSQAPWGPAQADLRNILGEARNIYGSMRGYPAQTGGMQPGAPMSSGGYGFANPFGMMGGQGGPGGYIEGGTGAWRSFPGQQPMQPSPFTSGQAGQPFDPSQVSGYNLWAPAEQEMMKTISGERLTGNPYLDEMIARASQDVNAQFSGMSRYGSGAHMDNLFTKAAAPIRYQNYAAERQNQLQAIGALPSFQQGLAGAPYGDLNAYLNIVNPIAGQGRTGTASQPLTSNPLAGAAGGALAGAGLGSMMATPAAAATGGMAAVGGWPFLLGGALLGGLAS